MGGEYQLLKSRFESILVWKDSIVNTFPNLVQSLEQIRRWLLIAGWRVLDVGCITLELQSIIIIFEESSCDGRVEGNTRQAVIGVLGKEDKVFQVVS